MTLRRLAILSVCWLVLLGGPLHPAGAEDDAPFVVCDFEDSSATNVFRANRSKAEIVDDGGGEEGHAVRWIQAAAKDGGWLSMYCLPDDLRPYRRLVFRMRSIGPMEDKLTIRFRGDNGSLGADLGSVTETWQDVELLLPLMRPDDTFTGKDLHSLRFVCWETKGFQVEFDDIRLVKEGGGWRYTLEDLQAQGRDPAGLCYRLADAETEACACEVRAVRSAWERVPIKGRGKGHCLRWKVTPTTETVWLSFLAIPSDIRSYRGLRFRVRTEDKRIADDIALRIRSRDGSIGARMPKLTKRWNEVEFLLPRMEKQGEIDPEKVGYLRLVAWAPTGFSLDIDDVRLVKGPGGWRMSEEEHLVHLFGKSRVKKVKRVETEHFEIITDASAARRKLPKALEKTYEFVIASLGLDGMPGRLPVYIFQNPNLYHEFCVRKGWSREEAAATAGHAGPGFFATYYQAAETPTVTHELAHSIFHRTRGTGGGSWFQEGVAVYVEELSQKRSAAKVFAPRIRSEQYMGLSEFISSKRLIKETDIRGGAGTSESLYLQAGAFFEFLFRGPLAKSQPKAIEQLALIDPCSGEARLEAVEKILGAPIAEIEKAWIEWGQDPPAHPKR